MTDIPSIGLSGLDAAMKRADAAANNIANASTPNYKPLQVVQQANPNFGTRADIRLAPESRDVDMASEVVDLKQAVSSYQANVAVLRMADDMQRELLRDFRV